MKTIAFEIKVLANLIKRKLDEGASEEGYAGFTGMQGWIIGYLKAHSDRAVFQRDLEKDFNIRRATVTGVLQLMERHGLIERKSVEFDARLKRITLTAKAEELLERIMQKYNEFEQQLCYGLSEEELSSFFSISEKLLINLQKEA